MAKLSVIYTHKRPGYPKATPKTLTNHQQPRSQMEQVSTQHQQGQHKFLDHQNTNTTEQRVEAFFFSFVPAKDQDSISSPSLWAIHVITCLIGQTASINRCRVASTSTTSITKGQVEKGICALSKLRRISIGMKTCHNSSNFLSKYELLRVFQIAQQMAAMPAIWTLRLALENCGIHQKYCAKDPG
jgi:hypothetical protein